MVCLGRIEKKESYLSALPEQGISYLLNQNATGSETSQLNSAMLHLHRFSGSPLAAANV